MRFCPRPCTWLAAQKLRNLICCSRRRVLGRANPSQPPATFTSLAIVCHRHRHRHRHRRTAAAAAAARRRCPPHHRCGTHTCASTPHMCATASGARLRRRVHRWHRFAAQFLCGLLQRAHRAPVHVSGVHSLRDRHRRRRRCRHHTPISRVSLLIYLCIHQTMRALLFVRPPQRPKCAKLVSEARAHLISNTCSERDLQHQTGYCVRVCRSHTSV